MKIGRVFLSVMLHQAKESEEKIILGCISAGCPGDNLDNKSDFGLESGPLDYRISSRTKSCAGDSDLQENVFFSGKLSGLIFFFFFPAIKGQRGGFYHVAALQRTSCGHPDQSPALLPSFPRKTLLVGLKGREK